MIKLSARDDDREEMEEHFKKRTNYHIKLVQKYLSQIQKMNLPEIDNNILEEEKKHDEGKWNSPEHEPYLHVSWKYKLKDDGKEYNPPEEIKKKMDEATFHHITHHKHHPDYWDKNITRESLNSENRDKPSGKIVNATKMPLTYVASMMAHGRRCRKKKELLYKNGLKTTLM